MGSSINFIFNSFLYIGIFKDISLNIFIVLLELFVGCSSMLIVGFLTIVFLSLIIFLISSKNLFTAFLSNKLNKYDLLSFKNISIPIYNKQILLLKISLISS